MNKNIPPSHSKAKITVLKEPQNQTVILPWYKTVYQLLEALNLSDESALIIREGQLLTYDRHLWPNDKIIVRLVSSGG